jgi:hypothetical protein
LESGLAPLIQAGFVVMSFFEVRYTSEPNELRLVRFRGFGALETAWNLTSGTVLVS